MLITYLSVETGAEPAGQTTTSSYKTGTLRIQLRDATGTPIEREVDVTVEHQSDDEISASNSQSISVSGGAETLSIPIRQGRVQATAVVNGQQKQAKASVDDTESRITLRFDGQQLAVNTIDQSSSQDPNPIAGVDITAEVTDDSHKQSYRGQTDQRGQWRQQLPLSASEIEITADHNRYEKTTRTIAIGNGQAQTNIQMRQLGGEIHATVTIGDEPVSDVPIIAIREETGDKAVLDPDTNGSVIFKNTPVGSYIVKPDLSEYPNEYSANEHNVAVTDGEIRRVQLSMSAPLNHLLSQGRQLVRDARDAQESDNLDAAIGLWEEADDKYAQARGQARERNHSQVDNIEKTRTTIREEIATARTKQAENNIKEALMSAWNNILTGDNHLIAETPDPDRARTAYDRAITEYETAIEHLQDDIVSAHIEFEDAETALTILQEARDDCDVIGIAIRLEDAVVSLSNDIENAPLSELTDILDECAASAANTELIYEQTLSTAVYVHTQAARSELQRSQSLTQDERYHEAQSALSEAEEELVPAVDALQQAPEAVTVPEAQTAVTKSEQQIEAYQSAINKTLLDIEADPVPSLRSLDEIALTPPTVSNLPSYSAICQTAPVESALWQAVAPELRSEYDALQSLLTTIDDSEYSRWLSSEHDDQIILHQTTLDDIEPLTASETLRSRREEVLSDCRSVVTALNQRVTTDLNTLEDANLPEEFVGSHKEVGQIDTDSLREIDDIEQFTQKWLESVNRLINTLSSLEAAVSIVEAYDEIAGIIDERLTSTDAVSPEELPVEYAEEALKIYAHRQSNAVFDSDRSLLRVTG